jgi:hypothetical protein
MFATRAVLIRTRIREVIPEIVPPDELVELPDAGERESTLEATEPVAEASVNEAATDPVVVEEEVAEREEPEQEPQSLPEVLVAEAAAAAVEVAPAETEPARVAPAAWTCEIAVWRGYRKASFYARTYVDGEEVAVAESPFFRADGNGIPDRNEKAEVAYEAICEQLEREGWKRVSRGETWFGDRFQQEIAAVREPVLE